jgi:hypothetical protein
MPIAHQIVVLERTVHISHMSDLFFPNVSISNGTIITTFVEVDFEKDWDSTLDLECKLIFGLSQPNPYNEQSFDYFVY